jgi:hypothetical protein
MPAETIPVTVEMLRQWHDSTKAALDGWYKFASGLPQNNDVEALEWGAMHALRATLNELQSTLSLEESGRPSLPKVAAAEPVARLRVFMDTHDMGQSLAPPDPPFKVAIASSTRHGDSLPVGTYDLHLAAPQPAQVAPAAQPESLQRRVEPWLLACFGEVISADMVERNHRFLEEALELVQSCGCTQSDAHQLVDYVYGRPVGERFQEAGGVMITLAALCRAQGIDMHAAGEVELARIWTLVEKIRAKQAAKPKHSPLPAASPPAPQPAAGEARELSDRLHQALSFFVRYIILDQGQQAAVAHESDVHFAAMRDSALALSASHFQHLPKGPKEW